MRKIIAYLILITIIFSSFVSIHTFAAEESKKIYIYGDMESYKTSDLTDDNENYCEFGSHADEAEISSDYAYSGNKSIKLANRKYASSGLKCIDVFGKKLEVADAGKTFRISLMLYPDKNTGVYKTDIKDHPADKWNQYLFSY